MALWTNAGINLVASAVQTPGVAAGIAYVGIGTGAGTLSTALVSGTPYSTLVLDHGVPVALSVGQSVLITDGVNTDTATVASPGTAIGSGVVPLSGYTAGHNFAAHVTGLCPVQAATDIALYNETARVAANAGVAGANPGESLNSGYFDGTQATAVYMQVGYFGGSTATNTTGTGTLMIEDSQFWNHTQNNDSNTYQADNTI